MGARAGCEPDRVLHPDRATRPRGATRRRLADPLSRPRERGKPRRSGAFRGGCESVARRAAEVLEALVELLDATGRVHDALLARVERVRGRRDFDVDDGVVDAVELDRLVAGDRRTGQERLARAEVAEHDGRVVGVDVSLHGDPLRSGALDFARA